jgi:hypothetical protein
MVCRRSFLGKIPAEICGLVSRINHESCAKAKDWLIRVAIPITGCGHLREQLSATIDEECQGRH